MRATNKYIFFWSGLYSQWYASAFTVKEFNYVTAEQYMMHQKALLFGDEDIAAKIMLTNSPEEQKLLGRQITGFDKAIWDKSCLAVVYEGNYAKFTQNEKLKKELLESGDKIIVEGSPSDTIWGVGLHWNTIEIEDPKNWQGLNLLGSAIMLVRNTLRDEI